MTLSFNLVEVFIDPALGYNGNVAAVIELENPLKKNDMQRIAADLNQPATTFLWSADTPGHYHVRWFAPDAEIGLCGHGSLAAFASLGSKYTNKDIFILEYNGGQIQGQMDNSGLCSMQLQAIPVLQEEKIPQQLHDALGIPLTTMFSTNNKYIVLAESENDVQQMKPDFARLRELQIFGYAVTASGDNVDFVSRTLVPHVQQLEDSATGSSHAALTPFWANRLGKSIMTAHQLSKRGGKFICELHNENVILRGDFKILAKGEFNL